MFQEHVSSVSSISERMLQVFYLNIAYVADSYVAICSKCFVWITRILQLFHLGVAKVNLDVRVEETTLGGLAP
jgi:hypothetical protein